MDAIMMRKEFEGHTITTITYRGKPAWIAREVGEAIGYADGGKRMATRITGEWSAEFLVDHDYVVLVGQELSDFKALLEPGTESVPSRTSSILILLESGLHLALAKTNKPIGQRLRRYMVDEVFPQIARDGAYMPDRQVVDNQIVPRDLVSALRLAADTEEARLAAVAKQEAAEQRVRLIGADRRQVEPLVVTGRAICASPMEYPMRVVANAIRINGKTIGRNKLIQLLRDHRFLAADNGPYRSHVIAGRAAVRISERGYRYTVVTGKGIAWIVNMLDADIDWDQLGDRWNPEPRSKASGE